MEIPIDIVLSFIGGAITGISGFLVYLKRKQKKMMDDMSDMIEDMGGIDEG